MPGDAPSPVPAFDHQVTLVSGLLKRALPNQTIVIRSCTAVVVVPVAGCAGPQSALEPAGREATEVAELFWVMTAGAAVIWTAVMAILLFALLSRRHARGERTASVTVWTGGIIFPVVVLTALLAWSLPLMPAFRNQSSDLVVEVVGEQYWFRVRYQSPDGSAFETANELRLPLGARTELRLSSADVIHSFWAPALAGKMDMIPGRTNRLIVEPRRAGRYRGVCAELCGESHALMAFDVMVLEPGDFAIWARDQARPAFAAATTEEKRGQEVFAAVGCAACHAVRGTSAAGLSGPDLTHVGARPTIAAGLLPNNVGTLAGWIAAPQDLKPGAKMPAFRTLAGDDLRALAAYMAALK